jgi:hypothetical protein
VMRGAELLVDRVPRVQLAIAADLYDLAVALHQRAVGDDARLAIRPDGGDHVAAVDEGRAHVAFRCCAAADRADRAASRRAG